VWRCVCSKQVQQELKKSLDLLKSAVSRAPMVSLQTEWENADGDEALDDIAGKC
jgi:hypothetical protein